MKIKELIFEGGNIWKGDSATIRIDKDLVKPTVAFLEKITRLPLLGNMLGSTGKTETSGDIDLAVNAAKENKENLVNKLTNWAKQNDPTAQVRKTGISVHFRCPIAGKSGLGYIQVDFMFFSNIKFSKWIYSPQEKSKYKNIARTILIASIARYLGYRFSTERGLVNRETDQPLAKGTNPDFIARTLLGNGASNKNLVSVESILQTLRNDPDKAGKLEDAIETFKIRGFPLNELK